MIDTFLATLTPMLTLLLCLSIGFVLRKEKLLPDNSAKVMAMLENWVFCPALSFLTMAQNFRINEISEHATNMVLSTVLMFVSLFTAVLLSRVFIKTNTPERGIYAYALMFGNFSYVGDPLILAMFGKTVLTYYKFFTIPLIVLVYTWGLSALVPKDDNAPKEKQNKLKNFFKNFFSAPTIALLIGIVVGLTDTFKFMPEFFVDTLDNLSGCMGPVAMLLAGFTIAGYSMKEMLTRKKVYFATGLRLIVLPALLIAVLFAFKELAGAVLGTSIDNNVLYFAFFAFAAPLGLNTVVFPEAYGGDPKTGAGMALISHTLCVLSIPLLYALMVLIFGSLSI